ncbi:hypothetical protein GCM10022204_24810 [Microlunatus aurantiacus]|uniref:Uncharacterized protein n=1 Tax=Microlunatus aurantiacus TaxID=446786 RepID=A0ABP7DJQ2_9ACTN
MSHDQPAQHSGSRWEPPAATDPTAGRAGPAPVSGADSAAPPDLGAPGVGAPDDRRSRRRRGPLLAALAAVLTLGASAAGLAYVQAAQEPGSNEPAAVSDAAPDPGLGRGARGDEAGPQVPRLGDGDDADGDGRHHRDGADGAGSPDTALQGGADDSEQSS